jgi:hypothetical protein
MYPHVVQFETRSQEFELERQLIRERRQARASKTVGRPSLLAKIGSALAELVRGEVASRESHAIASGSSPKK